jgi:hypothetical protein
MPKRSDSIWKEHKKNQNDFDFKLSFLCDAFCRILFLEMLTNPKLIVPEARHLECGFLSNLCRF